MDRKYRTKRTEKQVWRIRRENRMNEENMERKSSENNWRKSRMAYI